MERRRVRLDAITHRLGTALKAYRETHLNRIVRQRDRVGAFGERAERAIRNLIANRAARSERAGQLLTAFSYRGVLSRGFALVRDAHGHPLRLAAAVQPGMTLDIEFADGRVGATADGAGKASPPAPAEAPSPAAPAKPRTRSGGGSGPGQPVRVSAQAGQKLRCRPGQVPRNGARAGTHNHQLRKFAPLVVMGPGSPSLCSVARDDRQMWARETENKTTITRDNG